MTTTLRVTETFFSLQGESSFSGRPTFFIRLTGCPLRCRYCDTAYAFHGGEKISIDTLLDEARSCGARFVCVTGGEPLAQPDCLVLLAALCDAGFVVSLETSGAVSVAGVDPRVIKILDIKTPQSGEQDKNHWENLDYLTRQDQVKFVLCDRADYDWACRILQEHHLPERVDEILFSTSAGQLQPYQLAQWILADRVSVRFQLQLHKIIWGNRRGV